MLTRLMTMEVNGEAKYSQKLLNVVLIQPEIPTNTGNIGRTCVATCSKLHLVGPLGFEITDKRVKRAGLDYWTQLEWQEYPDYESWWKQIEDQSRVFFFTTKVQKTLFETEFREGDWLVFGRETKGLPEGVVEENLAQARTIPMLGKVRSFNLANSVAMCLSEAMRQLRF